MFDTPLNTLYNFDQVSRIAEEAASRALQSFVSQYYPGSGSTGHLDNRIALQSNHPSEQPKVTLTVKDMADLLGISMPKAYELTHQPGFPVIRVGRKALINKDMLLAWMAEQSAPKGE